MQRKIRNETHLAMHEDAIHRLSANLFVSFANFWGQ